MKLSIYSFAAAYCLIAMSCKKDSASVTPTPKNANTPTCAYLNYEQKNGVYSQFLYFFDLRSKDNAQKRYFKLQWKFTGVVDSFEQDGAVHSINNLSAGFPTEITVAPGYGAVNQWTNPEYRLLSSQNSYYKDPAVTNPQSSYYFYYQNFLSGPLAGKWPQSNFDNYQEPTGQNGVNTFHARTVFYFQEGLCIDGNSIKSINLLYKGAPNYDWKNVNTAIQLFNSGTNTFYFIDFKNWRFFRWKQFMNNIFSPAQLATTFEDYQSLDKLIKWPDGWGKQ